MTAVERFVHAVETNMREEIARTPTAAPARRLLDAGGKRLRARLLWWSANAAAPAALSPENASLVGAATAIEFAHLGSLVHDDIVDGSETRRGVPTVHREHGVRIATDAGAALAHLASELVAPLGYPARRAVRRALLATCRGQIRELCVPFEVLPLRTRLAIMQEKTGAFFELAATLGALVGGGDPRARSAVRRFARRFGVAFQIADDVLDLAGDPRVLGRANGADLRDGVVTLPALLALAAEDETLPRSLARLRTNPDASAIAECATLITKGGGVTAASAVATWWLTRAIDALRPLRQDEHVAALIAMARASVQRGLRPGPPTFVASSPHTVAATSTTTAFIEARLHDAPASAASLDDGLVRVLDWFHPGLSAMVAARADVPAIDSARTAVRAALCQDDRLSHEARAAADAIALAHAMASDEALNADPVRTLAMVDALHCAAIAFLTSARDAHEHQRIAVQARQLLVKSAPMPVRAFARRSSSGQLEAASSA